MSPTEENYEERAAILEYEAGMTREQAEQKARELIGERDELATTAG